MTYTARKLLFAALSLLLAAAVFFCVVFGSTPFSLADSSTSSVDLSETIQEATSLMNNANALSQTVITLQDNKSKVEGTGASVNGNTITIQAKGYYLVSGTLSQGQIVIDTNDSVILALNGVSLANSAAAAIDVTDANLCLIYLCEGTENTITSGTEKEITSAQNNTDVENASGAALYSKDSLVFFGDGTLNVYGYINNGIATTNDFILYSGNVNITAVNNGLKGKDSVNIYGGNVTITSGNDGIKSNNETDSGYGCIDIQAGTITVESYGDCLSAITSLYVSDGSFSLTTLGATTIEENSKNDAPQANSGVDNQQKSGPNTVAFGRGNSSSDNSFGGGNTFGGGNFFGGDSFGGGSFFGDNSSNGNQFGGLEDFFGNSTSSTYGKGIKCSGTIEITGGTFTVTTSDDAIHANDSIVISGGTMTLSTSDDGIHADNDLTISGGSIQITKSYEGFEATNIYIKDGTISIVSSDDGMNASSGSGLTSMLNAVPNTSFSTSSSLPQLQIDGGTISVNAGGDGLDSNGDLIINGGTIIVDGPSDSANGALDSGTESGGSLLVNGGTVLAIGSSGMAECFESESSQAFFQTTTSTTASAGSTITITDAEGTILFSHVSEKSFNNIVFSCPELVEGNKYTVKVNNVGQSVTATKSNSSSGSMFGGGGTTIPNDNQGGGTMDSNNQGGGSMGPGGSRGGGFGGDNSQTFDPSSQRGGKF